MDATGLAAVGGFSMVIAFVFLLVLWILWLILPFAVFGIRKRLVSMEADLQAMRKTLADVSRAQTSAHPGPLLKEVHLTNQILAAVHNVQLPEE